jgi:hypothetical protein
LALPQGKSKAELQHLYGKTRSFGNFNLHHLIPSTREGETNEFNLFPFGIKRHNAYHAIFLNMTIWEVWEALEGVYQEIFCNDRENITRHWLRVCRLKKDNELGVQVNKVFGTGFLQEKWFIAFGGDDINQAKNFLKQMMLFMIFGSRMADTDSLFNNGNLGEFFEKYPANEDRFKAFNICFGEFADWQRIKAKMSKMLR